ncbi:MAG: hypothetical protein Q9181_007604, partial [Wetmoreana brouardii]
RAVVISKIPGEWRAGSASGACIEGTYGKFCRNEYIHNTSSGSIKQCILSDTNPADTWQRDRTICFILEILNDLLRLGCTSPGAILGEGLPAAGLPFFNIYNQTADITGSLEEVKSTKEIDKIKCAVTRQVNGINPPETPVSAATYASQGLPLFDIYNEASNIKGSFQEVKSIKEADIQRALAVYGLNTNNLTYVDINPGE